MFSAVKVTGLLPAVDTLETEMQHFLACVARVGQDGVSDDIDTCSLRMACH